MGFSENGGMSPADFAAMTGNGGFGGFAGDGAWWIIILFLFCFMGNGWGNGAGAGNATLPLLMAQQTDSGYQRGFDQASLMGAIGNVGNAVTTGFGDTALGLANLGQAVMQQGYQGQIAMLQGFNAQQAQFANCCCENRLGIANLGADIAREACADRQAVNEAFMGITAQGNANTNLLVNTINQGVQSIKDLQIQQLLDSKDKEIARLERENFYGNLSASQVAQTAQLVADNTAQTQYIVNRVAPYPIPSYTVPNPNGTAAATG